MTRTTFEDFIAELEADAHAEGPEAVADLNAFRLYFSLVSGLGPERLVELSSLVERLARVVRPSYIPVWLSKPLPALGNDKPIERIASGDYHSVAHLISGLEDPGAS